MKRFLDIFLSAVGLLALLPFLPIVAVLIKIDSPGPVFFLQERVGKDFRRFWIYKFRTMRVNAEKEGRRITTGADRRITRIGAFLRKYKIDELPQLMNVIKGDMSLVGPRPEVEEYVKRYEAVYLKLLKVRPGITDPASLKFSDEQALLGKASGAEEVYLKKILPEKLKLSAQYVDHQTLPAYFKLIILTLLTTVHKRENKKINKV